MKDPVGPWSWKDSGHTPKSVHFDSPDDGKTWQGKIFGLSIPSMHTPRTSGGSRSSAKVSELDSLRVVMALHSTQIRYFLEAKPTGLDLLLGSSGHGLLLTNTLLQHKRIRPKDRDYQLFLLVPRNQSWQMMVRHFHFPISRKRTRKMKSSASFQGLEDMKFLPSSCAPPASVLLLLSTHPPLPTARMLVLHL